MVLVSIVKACRMLMDVCVNVCLGGEKGEVGKEKGEKETV